jgi:orotate phosphoribosyltransferase
MAVGLAAEADGHDLPVFAVRMEQKQHGAKDLIAEPYSGDDNGVVSKGRKVAIVEDTITTGGSVLKAIEAVEARGAEVVLIAVLVERHEGGADALRAKGYNVVSLFRASEAGQLSVNEASPLSQQRAG